MGFLSKLFGGDTDTPSSQSEHPPRSRAMPTEPPQASPDEEPTADHTRLAAKQRAALKAPVLSEAAKNMPKPRAQSKPIAPSRAARGQSAPEDNTQRDVGAVANRDIHEAQEAAANKPQRSRAARKRSPGFYSVSGFEAVSEPQLGEAGKVEITASAPERAPAVQLEPLPNPEGRFSPARDDKEETNPGLGFARSRHDPQEKAALPVAEAELIAQFGVELSLGQGGEQWLPEVSAAVEQLLSAARKDNQDEWVKPLRSLSQLFNDTNTPFAKRRAAIADSLSELQSAAPLPFDIGERTALCEGLIVEFLLADVPGVDSSVIQKIQRKKLAHLEFWENLDHESLSRHFPQAPDWADDAQIAFQKYSEGRLQRRLSAVKQGKPAAIAEQVEALSVSAQAFQTACDDDDSARRRSTRRERQEQSTALNLLLAEFGEVDILREIEHSSVQIKIERLGQWLSALKTGL